MLKKFYIQTENDTNKITDVIEYEHSDYKEVQLNTPIPTGILNGAYKLINESVIYIPEWDTNKLKNKIDILEKENADLLLDSAIKDNKLATFEKDLADITLQIAKGGM